MYVSKGIHGNDNGHGLYVDCNDDDDDDADAHYYNISSQSPYQPTLTPLVCVLPFSRFVPVSSFW